MKKKVRIIKNNDLMIRGHALNPHSVAFELANTWKVKETIKLEKN